MVLFIAWVVLGGLVVLRWPRLAWLHLPAVAWGVWIELTGGVCPLTPLEQRLRLAAGEAGYSGGFIEHYLGALIYPAGLTRGTQWMLAGIVLGDQPRRLRGAVAAARALACAALTCLAAQENTMAKAIQISEARRSRSAAS